MAARYLITGGGSVTWTDSDTSIWSASSGGATGASVPGSGDTVTMDAASGGGTVTLAYDPTVVSITGGAFTGTFDATGRTINVTTFSFSGTGTRTLNITNATINISGNNASVWNTGTATNLTFTSTGSTINLTYSGSTGTRTIAASSPGNVFGNLNVTAGSDTFNNSTGASFENIDFSGFSGTWTSTVTSIITRGNFTAGVGMSISGPVTLQFGGTTGTKILTSNGVTIGRHLNINCPGGTVQLADDFVSVATRILTISQGTLDMNGKNITIGNLVSSGTSTRSFLMRTGTLTLLDSGTVWNTATVTNFTLDAGTSTIKLTDTSATAKTFSGGGQTYYDLWNAPGAGTASLTIVGSNTFHMLKDDGSAAHSWLFTAGTTQTISQWQIRGNSGALITIDSPTAATHALTLAGVGTVSTDYLSIKNSVASPTTATWFAGANSTDVSGNTGWIFTIPTLHKSNFFMFF